MARKSTVAQDTKPDIAPSEEREREEATPAGAEELSQSNQATADRTREDLEKELQGFKDLAPPDKADGWFQPAAGALIIGTLKGRYIMSNMRDDRGKPRAFYQLLVKTVYAPRTLSNPNGDVFMVAGKGDEAEMKVVQKGHLLAIDEKKALQVLEPYAESSDGVFAVSIEVGKKIPIPNSRRTFWQMSVRVKVLREPKRPIRTRVREDEEEYEPPRRRDEIDDDVPF